MRDSILKRFNELINEVGFERVPIMRSSIRNLGRIRDTDGYYLWLKWAPSALNLIEKTFGKEIHYKMLQNALNSRGLNYRGKLSSAVRILESAKEEIKKGFLYKINHLVASDIFDSILQQAKHFLKNKNKDTAAIYGRIVIEEELRDICKKKEIKLSGNEMVGTINDKLKSEGVFDKSFWRKIQGHIDVGSDAAHGHFDKYKESDVKEMLDFIENRLIPFD